MKSRPHKVKSTRKKASSIKHANKKYSKMQKQGKLRKKAAKKKPENGNVNDIQTHVSDSVTYHEDSPMYEVEKEVDVLDMIEQEDIQFLNTSRQNYSFLNQNNFEKPTKRKKEVNSEDEEMACEKYPRTSTTAVAKVTRPLLPLKGKRGLILQSEEIKSSDESENSADELPPVVVNDAEEPKVEYTAAQQYAMRQKKLSELKLKVASMSNTIIENPENNARLLKELRLLLEDSEIGLIGYKLVLMSLLEVFKDIIPGYQIVLNTEDNNHKMKKDTKSLVEYEQGLLRSYKHYLKKLEQLLQGIKAKVQKSNASDAMKRSSLTLGETAVTCFCELLAKHPHFNCSKIIISLIVPLMAHDNQNISDRCCSSVRSVFKDDKLGEVSLEIVRHITKLVKNKNFDVNPKILETFLALKLKDANLNADDKKQQILTRKEWYKKFSRKERKFKKRMASLDKELLEAEAEESKQKKSRFHTDTVKLIFLCYFRILKQCSKSALLSSVLEGLAKYAHLINIDFFDDLIKVLFMHMESGELSYKESLHCAKTVFTILSGQGEALNIDPQKFYSHLYHSCLFLSSGLTSEDVILLLECVQMMIIQRRKKISLQRILAFMKRLSSLSLQLLHNGVLGCLSYVRTLLLTYRTSDILLDPDCSSGSGCFLPELSDPDHCNAQSTSLWELHSLCRHYHPDVRKFAVNIMYGAPIQGNGHLPVELSKKDSVQLYEEYNAANMSFKPAIPVLDSTSIKKPRLANIGENEQRAFKILHDANDN